MPSESSTRSSRKRSRQEPIPEIVIPDSDDLFGSPSPAPEARPAKKQRRVSRQETSSSSTSQPAQQSSKARRTSTTRKQQGLKKEQAEDELILEFDDSDEDRNGGEEIIDLLGSDDAVPPPAPPVPAPPKEDNVVKLGNFQCVICMDDCTDLTVTHCGMSLFLRLFLQSSTIGDRILTR